MRTSTGRPTLAEAARMDALKEHGCLIAHRLGLGWTYAEIHHLISGGRRRGHRYTIALNPWSHRGVPFNGMDSETCFRLFGPSLAHGSKPFRERFGSDDELLAEQDLWIGWEWKEAA